MTSSKCLRSALMPCWARVLKFSMCFFGRYGCHNLSYVFVLCVWMVSAYTPISTTTTLGQLIGLIVFCWHKPTCEHSASLNWRLGTACNPSNYCRFSYAQNVSIENQSTPCFAIVIFFCYRNFQKKNGPIIRTKLSFTHSFVMKSCFIIMFTETRILFAHLAVQAEIVVRQSV